MSTSIKQTPGSLQGLFQLVQRLETNVSNGLLNLKHLKQPQIVTDLSKAMNLSEDAAAQKGIIDVVTKYVNDLPKQSQNQTLDTRQMALVASDLRNFLEQYQGKVSGEFASRFQRIHQGAVGKLEAEAEIEFAKDLMQNRTILGGGKVEGVLEVAGRKNPEFLFRSGDGSIRAIEVKTLTTSSLERIPGRLSEAAEQIEALSGSVTQRGLIRVNLNTNPPLWSVADLRQTIETWALSSINKSRVEFVEFIYYDEAGVLRKIIFRNGKLVT